MRHAQRRGAQLWEFSESITYPAVRRVWVSINEARVHCYRRTGEESVLPYPADRVLWNSFIRSGGTLIARAIFISDAIVRVELSEMGLDDWRSNRRAGARQMRRR